ncbi:carbon-nitrogen hydrolase family protein [Tenggerimyces flavus]|uniref:Carbon-nitrogen hydrolase family protein n=1 Tax=Tenggerimyces flavus TaxID=1708749 RepID=A0ABV7Y789_9ACTN|nr:carbon-nitrogen hydrolase family protein [Tenggerimyces flavus]MBM7788455.1 putative amidohydrolase [Tenggerimyces flavus]
MRVAAWQAPYLPFGSMDAVGLLRVQLSRCEAEGVAVLCCPEAVIGGLAHESSGDSPAEVALTVAELTEVVAPLLDSTVTVIVGFTERDPAGGLYGSAAVLRDGRVADVYRKVYPGYRTVIGAGAALPVFESPLPFGIVICNDLWYVEPTRVLAAGGAAVIFVPTHSGHLREPSASFRARGDNLPIARAVENSVTVVVADVAGRQGERFAYGFSAVIDPDGQVLTRATSGTEELLIADVEPRRRDAKDPRGWDGHTNPAVTRAFLRLWQPD